MVWSANKVPIVSFETALSAGTVSYSLNKHKMRHRDRVPAGHVYEVTDSCTYMLPRITLPNTCDADEARTKRGRGAAEYCDAHHVRVIGSEKIIGGVKEIRLLSKATLPLHCR